MAKNFLRLIPSVVVAACMGLLPKVSLGAVLQVCHSGCAYSTIQSAVNAAGLSGDTINVAKDIYAERVTIAGKGLSIVGNGATVQSVGYGGPVFTLGAGSGPYYEVDLTGLTVTGGDHDTSSEVGGGIQVRVGAFLHLFQVTVTNNLAGYGGGIGVMTPGGPATTLNACSITGNGGLVNGGGIYVGTGASVEVQGCYIYNNNSEESGGGIYTENGSTLTANGANVSGNTTSPGCGLHHCGPPGNGGGLYVGGNLSLSYSVVAGNAGGGDAGGSGGGLFLVLGGTISIQHTVVTQNSVFGGTGGGIFAQASNPGDTLSLDSDYIVLNTFDGGGTPSAGGVANEGTLVLSGGTTIANNTSPDCAGGTGCPQ